MSRQAIFEIHRLFELTQVLVDVFTELVTHVQVLPLLIRRVLTAEASRGMQVTNEALARQKIGVRYDDVDPVDGVEFAGFRLLFVEIVLLRSRNPRQGVSRGHRSRRHSVTAASCRLSRQGGVVSVRSMAQDGLLGAVMHGDVVLRLKMSGGPHAALMLGQASGRLADLAVASGSGRVVPGSGCVRNLALLPCEGLAPLSLQYRLLGPG